jgi:hypothetical protein
MKRSCLGVRDRAIYLTLQLKEVFLLDRFEYEGNSWPIAPIRFIHFQPPSPLNQRGSLRPPIIAPVCGGLLQRSLQTLEQRLRLP